MSDLKVCPECGASLVSGDRFCGECGFDINSMTEKPAASAAPVTPSRPVAPPPVAPTHQQPQQQSYQQPQNSAAPYTPSAPPAGGPGPMPGRNYDPPGTNPGGSKNALFIMVSVLVLLFLAGGGIYWWLSKDDPSGNINGSGQAVTQQNGTPATDAGSQNAQAVPDQTAPQADLSRAATYLTEPGLKCTFFVNYPDGMSGVVDRISAQAVPNESVRVTDVEVGIDMGEEYGFGFHYVERNDGTYYIMDSSPYEIFPVLKNNLTVGQKWSYDSEYGSILYEVMDMGVDLDLGFAKFEDCLLLYEDNQAVGQQSISYYAPGRGIVYVVAPGGNFEYYKMTAMTNIDLAEAANTIIKWCPNYLDIKDERSQSH